MLQSVACLGAQCGMTKARPDRLVGWLEKTKRPCVFTSEGSEGEPTVRPGSAGLSIKCQSNCLKNHSHVCAMSLPAANAASYEEAVVATMRTCAVRSGRLANERVVPRDFGCFLGHI